MKELSIEEKAKAYDEALERAKDFKNGKVHYALRPGESIVNWIFPELRESEDEWIRKDIISYIQVANQVIPQFQKDKWIAWLEKQGEHKSFDYENANIQQKDFAPKQEPKFKVGDWVILTAGELSTTLQIVNVDTDKKLYWFNDSSYLPIVDEECLHHWSIEDAKDGDVLVDDEGFIMLVDESRDSKFGYRLSRHCAVLSNGEFTTDNVHTRIDGLHPATKEQRDLLFQKMKEAGYEFDFEKKELRKINNALEECEIEHIEHGKYYYCIKDYYSGGCKRASKGEVVQALRGMSMMALGVKANEYFIPVKCIVNVSPAWSEEDEHRIEDTIYFLDTAKKHYASAVELDACINWLKSLKQRII